MTAEVNRGYLDHIKRWSRPSGPTAKGLVRRALHLISVPLIILLALGMVAGLRIALARRAPTQSQLHNDADAFVEGLVAQYPFHLYPVVAKSLELAYLKRNLSPLLAARPSVLEIAIGEGTLSARVFADRGEVTGLDLNPHSLVKSAGMPHVKRAIVGDALNPPVRPGAFDLVLALNFLHHVTDKSTTLASWARIARVLMFNENTPFWATSGTIPYVLKRLGLRGAARRAAARIERHLMQRLVGRSTLTQEVATVMQASEESFLSERCFFLCGLFSFLMISYGPPTPALLKRIFLGPLRAVALPLTTAVARLLVRLDAYQDRATDTFVFFHGPSRATLGPTDDPGDLLCPRCSSELGGAQCSACGASFPEADGMLFLLPSQFAYIFDEYLARGDATMPNEHL